MRDGRVVWTGDNDNLDAREVGCHMLGSTSSAEFDALAEERRQAAAGAMRA
jgi:hypothetical protein